MSRTSAVESTARVEFRMTESLKTEVEQAAALMGLSLTAFFSMAAIERAREVKMQHSITFLENVERDAFIEMISRPPSPNPALARLMATDVVL